MPWLSAQQLAGTGRSISDAHRLGASHGRHQLFLQYLDILLITFICLLHSILLLFDVILSYRRGNIQAIKKFIFFTKGS